MARRTLSKLKESGFHSLIKGMLPAGRSGKLPLGDDCAALPLPGGRALLLTTDAVVEGTHFPLGTPPRWVGDLAANVNLSDLAAKGGTPRALLLSLLLPAGTEVAWAKEVVRSVEEAAERAGAHLVGGDTKRSRVRAVTVLAVGEGKGGRLMPRSGARPGDLLAVTGTVGRGGARYLSWKRGLRSRKQALRDLLTVTPRLSEGRALSNYARASLDTSDGLVRSLRLMAGASEVSITLDWERLPLDPEVAPVARRLGLSPEEVAFLGGDYELLTAIPPSQIGVATRAVTRASGQLTVIGKVGGPGPHRMSVEGDLVPLPAFGWDAFDADP